MKILPILAATCLSSVCALKADVIYDYTFEGDGTTELNGTAVAPGGPNWVASSSIYTDGSIGGVGGAVLPHNFNSSIYESTAYIDLGFLGAGTSAFGGVYFTNSDPLAGGFITTGNPWGTFALRANGDFEFWAGENTTGNIDGGNLSDYGYSASVAADKTGLLRVVLDTTQANWTISAYYTPSSSGTEFQVDLNGGSEGGEYIYSSNPSSFTGAGVVYSFNSSGNQVFESYSLSNVPEPQTYALMLGGAMLALSGMRRWRHR